MRHKGGERARDVGVCEKLAVAGAVQLGYLVEEARAVRIADAPHH